MISKKSVLEMLWGAINEHPEALKLRHDAAKNKNKYWSSDEWIYIKDTEVSLKMLSKEITKYDLDHIQNIYDLICRGVGVEQFLENSWAIEKINDCRKNLKMLSNPDE